MTRAFVRNWRGLVGVLSLLLAGAEVFAADTASRAVAPEAEICKGCHEKYVETYLTTKQGQQGNRKGPDCQTCHANALEHAKAGGGKGVAGIFGFGNKSIPA